MTDKTIADRIEEGVKADIFYDAHDYLDTDAEAKIEDFQQACLEAVALLRQREPKQHTITLLWAEKPDPGDEATTYTFETEAEYRAFMLGIEAATGWINVRQVPEGFIVPDEGWTDDLADTYPDMF